MSRLLTTEEWGWSFLDMSWKTAINWNDSKLVSEQTQFTNEPLSLSWQPESRILPMSIHPNTVSSDVSKYDGLGTLVVPKQKSRTWVNNIYCFQSTNSQFERIYCFWNVFASRNHSQGCCYISIPLVPTLTPPRRQTHLVYAYVCLIYVCTCSQYLAFAAPKSLIDWYMGTFLLSVPPIMETEGVAVERNVIETDAVLETCPQ